MHRLYWLTFAALLAACSTSDGSGPNVGTRARSAPALHSFESCDALTERMRASLAERARINLLQYEAMYGQRNIMYGTADTAAPAAADATSGAPAAKESNRVEGVNYSTTNNQELGVDEADLVKTDGNTIFTLSGHTLAVLGVPQIGALEKQAELDIEGWPSQLLLSQAAHTLTAFSTVYVTALPADAPLRVTVQSGRDLNNTMGYRTTTLTKLTVIDVTTPAAPKVTRELYIEGYYQTARRIDTTVRMITYGALDVPGLVTYPDVSYTGTTTLSDAEWRDRVHRAVLKAIASNDTVLAATPLSAMVPQIYEKSGASFVAHPFTKDDCHHFTIAEDSTSLGVTSILSMDLGAATFDVAAEHIVTNWSQVYASLDTLIVAEPAADWWWYWGNSNVDEATNLHRFDISKPGVTRYTGSGRVPGTIRDQFALSELDGNIRVASTTGNWNRWWLRTAPSEPDNHVYVLAGAEALDIIGQLDGIATGERLWSSRFLGKRGYLVTFRNIDPLWTIDLADPTAPRIAGELQVPGVSTYIQPIDETHLLTIGFGGTGAGLDWTSRVALFDVTDFAAPKLDAVLPLAPPSGTGWNWSWSEATYEHKAFQYWAPLGLLAVPVSTYRTLPCAPTTSGTNASCMYGYSYEYFSKLALVKVDAHSLSNYGEVDHSGFYNNDRSIYWGGSDVRRSIFMHDDANGADFVYALSERGMTSSRLPDLSTAASVQLPGAQYDYFYYGMGVNGVMLRD